VPSSASAITLAIAADMPVRSTVVMGSRSEMVATMLVRLSAVRMAGSCHRKMR
jgi:hypothetical protein